jgi:hypothetical protein
MMYLTSIRRQPPRKQTEPTGADRGIHFKKIQSGKIYLVISPTRKKTLSSFWWKKGRHHSKGANSWTRSCMSHMSISASKAPKSSGKRLLNCSQIKKKLTHTSFPMHFMQQN